MAARRDAAHHHLGAAVLNRRRLLVTGDLGVEGPGVRGRLTGAGRDLVFTPDGGTSARPVRAELARAVETAARLGMRIRVVSAQGHELARIGPDIRSVTGWLFTGSAHLRPRLGGVRYALSPRRRRNSTGV